MLGPRHRLARPPPVQLRRALVGAAQRAERARLPRLALRGLGAPRCAVPLDLHRAPHRDGARALARRLLVASRARPSSSSIAALFTFVAPYLDFTTEPLADEALLAAADEYRARARRRGHPDPRRGGERRHRPGERVRVRDRAVAARRLLGHDAPRSVRRGRAEGRSRPRAGAPLAAAPARGPRLVRAVRDPRRVDPHARRREAAAAWARREAVPLALLVVAIFQLATRAARQPRLAAAGGRGGLEGASGHARPGRARRPHARLLGDGLGDPDPPGWVQLMVGTHPALADRIAMARAYAATADRRLRRLAVSRARR